MPTLKHIIETEFLPFVEKPMRYVGNELNIVRKNLRDIAVHGVLCFPEIYDIGMSHYGSQILYHVVNSRKNWALSRCYHPWSDAERLMRDKKIPLYTLEYFSPLGEADFLGFTVQYELQYTNLVNMLDMAGLNVLSAGRTEADPLVIAGGPCMGNPEPLADFLDACVVGDGEEAIVSICTVIQQAKQHKISRQHVLERLAQIEGVYVPRMYPARPNGLFVVPDMPHPGAVRAARIAQIGEEHRPAKPLVPLMDVVHHRLAVEIMRGCTRGCRFCSAGTYYRPVRERDAEAIRAQIEEGVATTGWSDMGLLSLSSADYTDLDTLLAVAQKARDRHHVNLSLPSTRIDALTEQQVKSLRRLTGSGSFTIAPEAGSQRLRDVINKDFSESQILKTAHTLLENNVQTLKLYFMIGLPTETDEDIDALVECVAKIADFAWAKARRRTIHVSISPFSPKPHTPFQWEAMNTREELARKNARIHSQLKARRNVKLSYRDPDMTLLETIMARGDRRLSELIMGAWKNGARFDGWSEQFSMQHWERAALGLDIDMHTYARGIPEEQPLPWSAVSVGVTMQFLLQERRNALAAKVTPDCRRQVCCGCGACSLTARKLVERTTEPFASGDTQRPAAVRAAPNHDPPQRYYWRATYAKGAHVRFLPHRDMVEVFHRALCAAGLPLAYSEGYHPHPRLSFGPPLALGILGDKELFDMVLTEAAQPHASTINGWLPQGLRLETLRSSQQKPDSLNANIVAARYVFVPHRVISGAALRKTVESIKNSKSLQVVSERNGQIVEKDLRPLIHKIEYYSHHDAACVDALLSMQARNTCRPLELLKVMFPEMRFSDFLVRRVECLTAENGKFAVFR